MWTAFPLTLLIFVLLYSKWFFYFLGFIFITKSDPQRKGVIEWSSADLPCKWPQWPELRWSEIGSQDTPPVFPCGYKVTRPWMFPAAPILQSSQTQIGSWIGCGTSKTPMTSKQDSGTCKAMIPATRLYHPWPSVCTYIFKGYVILLGWELIICWNFVSFLWIQKPL